MSKRSLDVGTVGMSFHVSCIVVCRYSACRTRKLCEKIHVLKIFLSAGKAETENKKKQKKKGQAMRLPGWIGTVSALGGGEASE